MSPYPACLRHSRRGLRCDRSAGVTRASAAAAVAMAGLAIGCRRSRRARRRERGPSPGPFDGSTGATARIRKADPQIARRIGGRAARDRPQARRGDRPLARAGTSPGPRRDVQLHALYQQRLHLFLTPREGLRRATLRRLSGSLRAQAIDIQAARRSLQVLNPPTRRRSFKTGPALPAAGCSPFTAAPSGASG